MKTILKIQGKDFVPARALPAMSSGAIDVAAALHIFADPETWAEAGDHLRPYLYDVAGKAVLQVTPDNFESRWLQEKQTPSRDLTRIPAGVVVELGEATHFFSAIAAFKRSSCRGRLPAIYAWNPSPPLTTSTSEKVFEGLPRPRRTEQNSRSKIDAVVNDIISKMQSLGVQLDRGKLPGNKMLWSMVISELNPRLRLAQDTFKDHFKALEMKWPMGQQAKTMNPILGAYGLPQVE